MQLGQEKQLVLMLSTGGVVVQSDSPARGVFVEPLEPPLDPQLKLRRQLRYPI